MELQRTILPLLEENVHYYPVTIITGPRLSGKKTLVRSAFSKKGYFLINFEDPEIRLKVQQAPQGFLSNYRGIVILSEINRVPELIPHITSFVKANPDNRLILISNQRMENQSLMPVKLTDQIHYLTLMPFGVEENTNIKKHKQSLSETCWYGGYPQMLFPTQSNSNYLLSQYLHNYIESDVRQLIGIGDTSQFLLFMKQCALRVGQLLNLTAIAKECSIAVNTAKAWMGVLETGYMVYRLPPYQVNFGRRVVKVPKLYFCDTGLLCYLLGIKSPGEVVRHELYSMIAENFMVNDIMKSFHHRGQSVSSIYFWRDHRGFEVDCLIEHDGKLRGIDLQSCTSESEIDYKEMERWMKESDSKFGENFIVYCGKAIKRSHPDILVYSWEDIVSTTGGVLVSDLSKFYNRSKKEKK